MEKLHRQFVDGCLRQPGMTEEIAEELFRQVAAFASFGFAKSHAAAFARTAYESSFLKLFYPAQFLVGLINAQPMGFYPVEVLVNDAKRHGVAVLPVDINAASYKTTTEWVGRPGRAAAPTGAGIDGRPEADPVAGLRRPVAPRRAGAGRPRARPAGASGSGCGLVKGIGEEHAGAPRRGAGARAVSDAWPTWSSGPGCPRRCSSGSIRAGALDSLGRPRRELLWQLREVAGAHAGGWMGGRTRTRHGRPGSGPRRPAGRWTCACPRPRRPTLPAIDRIRADRRRLRGRSGSMPGARWSGCSGPRWTGSGRCRTRRSPSAGPGRSGSAGSSSPASTR